MNPLIFGEYKLKCFMSTSHTETVMASEAAMEGYMISIQNDNISYRKMNSHPSRKFATVGRQDRFDEENLIVQVNCNPSISISINPLGVSPPSSAFSSKMQRWIAVIQTHTDWASKQSRVAQA